MLRTPAPNSPIMQFSPVPLRFLLCPNVLLSISLWNNLSTCFIFSLQIPTPHTTEIRPSLKLLPLWLSWRQATCPFVQVQDSWALLAPIIHSEVNVKASLIVLPILNTLYEFNIKYLLCKVLIRSFRSLLMFSAKKTATNIYQKV